MEKMIVIVFDEEAKAYEGLRSLKELDREGSLTLYAAGVIAKDADGKPSVKKSDDDQLGLGTAFGMATGSLLGILGGPIGVMFGATTGTALGSLYDLERIGVGSDFVDEVSRELSPGKTAVVAEIDEDWTTPLDTRVEALGGTLYRRARADFVDSQIERQIAAEDAELAALEAEYDQAVGEARAKLGARVEAARKRREALNDKISARTREAEAKLEKLRQKAEKASGETRAKLERRLSEARANHDARIDRMSRSLARLEGTAVD